MNWLFLGTVKLLVILLSLEKNKYDLYSHIMNVKLNLLFILKR